MDVKSIQGPPTAPRWVGRKRDRTLGVLVIVKNGVERLPALFESIREVADEVVVVDTGSTDGTPALCRAWGVTLVFDRWRDDFSRARNRGIQTAVSRYLLWLDDDDRLPEASQTELQTLRDEVLPTAGRTAFALELRNLDDRGRVRDGFSQLRIFPRLPGVRFREPVHEEIASSLAERGVKRRDLPIAVDHTGYASPEVVEAKHRKYTEMLRRSLERDGANGGALLQLAHSAAAAGELDRAVELLGRAVEVAEATPGSDRMQAEIRALRAMHAMAGADRLRVQLDLERSAELVPEWALPWALLAEFHLRSGEVDDAARAVDAMDQRSWRGNHVGLPVLRIRGAAARAGARISQLQGEPEAAAQRLRSVLEYDVVAVQVRLDLGRLLLDLGRAAEARRVLEPLGDEREVGSLLVDVVAAVGRARAADGDWDAAGGCLGSLLQIFAAELNGADDVSAADLALVLERAGHPDAARDLLQVYLASV